MSNYFPCAVYFILTSFQPTWTLSGCAMPLHPLVIQYWLHFDQFEVSVNLSCHSWDTHSLLISLWCLVMGHGSPCTINLIPWPAHSTVTSFPPLQTLRRCTILFYEWFIQYWPYFDHAELSGCTSCLKLKLPADNRLLSTVKIIRTSNQTRTRPRRHMGTSAPVIHTHIHTRVK